MKINKFNEKNKSDKEEEKNVQLLKDLLDENPISKTHDFYMFVGSDKFEETESGMYKKIIDIENMVRITGDEKSLAASQGLNMRARFQENSKVYHIWLPKEIRSEVEGKSSQSIDPWLVDLINNYKQRGSDEQGKRIFKDVKSRRDNMEKFNL